MKDAFGTELAEGDRVVYLWAKGRCAPELVKATVTKLTGTRIYFIEDGYSVETWTVPDRVMKLESK